MTMAANQQEARIGPKKANPGSNSPAEAGNATGKLQPRSRSAGFDLTAPKGNRSDPPQRHSTEVSSFPFLGAKRRATNPSISTSN
jgi:hypothetical protein